MDLAVEGGRGWSLLMLEGYSRPLLAGAVAPAPASGVALLGLSTASLRYGVPACLISDSGGAFPSNAFEAVCTRFGLDHTPMESTQGESSLHWMETHCNGPRRLFDSPCSFTTTPGEFERVHPTFLET